jgi:hypothetical protein
MTIENRIDEAINISSTVEETPEGYLMVRAPIARVGIMSYRMKDGSIRRELVPAETLFDPKSIDSLKLKPVTNRHPQEVLLDPKTVKRRNVGSVGEAIEPSGDMLEANFLITDQDAIDSVNSGRKQLSPGYQTGLDFTPGTWRGQQYDAVQVSREYNHLALVDNARGGPELKINMDSEDEIGLSCNLDNNNDEPQTNGTVMKKFVKVDGVEVEVPDSVATHVMTIEGKLDSATDQVTELTDKNAELQKKVDSFDEELKKRTDSAVSARVALVTTAKELFNSDSDDDKALLSKMDSMSNSELKKEIIVKVQPSAKAKIDSDDISDSYLDSRLDSALEIMEEKKEKKAEDEKQEKIDSGRKNMRSPKIKNDTDDNPVESSRQKMVRADESAWKSEEK